MLISVFLTLVSCHLGSLTIVSVPHILLLLHLALSVQREKRDVWAEDREEQGRKSEKHTRRCAGLGCQRQAEREKDKREERGEWIKEL